MVVNDSVVGTFDTIDQIRFEHSGKDLSYACMKDGKWFVFQNGAKSGQYDKLRDRHLLWNEKNAPAVYAAFKDGQCFYVIDGKEGPHFQTVSDAYNMGDGKTIAYFGNAGGKSSVIRGDSRYDYAKPVKMMEYAQTPAGTNLAWVVMDTSSAYLVINGKKSSSDYGQIGFMQPTGDGFCYEARTGKSWYYVIGDKKSPAFEDVDIETLKLRENGKTIIYAAQAGGFWNVYINDVKVSEPFDECIDVLVSPDGRTILCSFIKEGKNYVAVNAVKNGPYDHADLTMGEVAFSPDSKHWAYVAKKDKKQLLVTDGGTAVFDDFVFLHDFNADGELLYTTKENGTKRVLHIGKKTIGPFDEIGVLCYRPDNGIFSPDGKSTVLKIQENAQEWVMTGQKTSSRFDAIIYWSGEDDSGNVRFWALRGMEIWRIDVKPRQG